MSIPELLTTEELEPNCRNHDKKFKYKTFTLKFKIRNIGTNKNPYLIT